MPAQTKGKARPVITGSAPRGSLARRVAARSIFNSGQSRECPVHTGAGEGASGAKRRRTEQSHRAATHSQTAPMRQVASANEAHKMEASIAGPAASGVQEWL